MKFNRTTKSALFTSVVSLFLCFAMLLGTTFAWFTDSATSAGNKIVAGTLDVQLWMYDESVSGYVDISDSNAPVIGDGDALFGVGDTANENSTATLWEPGKTQVVYLKIVNAGSLDLKYQVAINVRDTDGEQNLYEVLKYDIVENAKDGAGVDKWEGGKSVKVGNNIDTTDVKLPAKKDGSTDHEHYFALVVHMDEDAGNKYQGGSVEFDIKVLATQVASEADSFDNQYDKGAGYYPNSSAPEEVPDNTTETLVLVSDKNAKVTLPAAIVSDKEQVSLNHTDIVCDAANKLVTIDAMELLDEEGNIIDLSANTTPFEVVIPVGGAFAAGETVLVYHDDVLVAHAEVNADGTISYTAYHFCEVKVGDPGELVAYFGDEYYKDIQAAVNAANGGTVLLLKNVLLEEQIDVVGNVSIDGNGYTVARTGEYNGVVFNVEDNSALTLSNVVVDGGAVWTGEVNPVLLRGTVNTGLVATGALVAAEGNGNIVLEAGTVIQNNDGVNAVSLATRGGGLLIVNGAYIINNTSSAGAIWGGDDVIVNEGSKINGNHATSIGGAFRMVNGDYAITFTMNGGEINHNYSDGTGGAIWGGNKASYYFKGGEMAYNGAASAGGAIWTGTYESYYITGDFKLHDNVGGELTGAIRFCDHASLTMTGGSVYNNTVNGVSNAFYLNNNSASITGGTITDNFSYSGGLGLTLGNAEIDGVINYNLGTNHNTAYLAAEFGSFKFTVNESAANFAMFNFKPAADYTYTEGDEAKLICMNEGYVTYWDAASGTFKLQAVVTE